MRWIQKPVAGSEYKGKYLPKRKLGQKNERNIPATLSNVSRSETQRHGLVELIRVICVSDHFRFFDNLRLNASWSLFTRGRSRGSLSSG